jgi:hypothetical protein
MASTWGGDCAVDGTITLLPGDNKTCTITNDDIAPRLTLVKTVVNDDGGLLTQADFPSFVDAVAQAWDVATAVTANVQHTASETPHAGYTPSVWGGDCAADGTITLLPGDAKTCTITNDDQQAYITVFKVVLNGSALPDDFDLTLGGNPVLSGDPIPVDPGTYQAGETLMPGYTFDGYTGDCNSSGQVTVALGESKTCTLTNFEQTAALLPTQTTCEMYRDHLWPPMYDAFTYGVKGGEINSISPGVIFYYNRITASAASFTVTQTNNGVWPDILVHQGQAILYNLDCTKASGITLIYQYNPYRVTFSGATAGVEYIIGIKYSPQNLVGQAVSLPYPTTTYYWDMIGYYGSAVNIDVKPR